MSKDPAESRGRQNPVQPELSPEIKKKLLQLSRRTGLDYDLLERNAKRLLVQPAELDRLVELMSRAGL